MTKQRDWIDYANLGSNIAQNLQLKGIQDTLGRIADASQSTHMAAERENQLRDLIFQADTILRNLRTRPDADASHVLVVAKEGARILTDGRVSTGDFSAYDDKTRLREIVEGYQDLIVSRSRNLGETEIVEVDRCIEYLHEQENLDCLIQHQQTQQKMAVEIEQKRNEMETTKRQSERVNTLRWIASAFMIVAVAVGLIAALIFASSENETTASESQLQKEENIRQGVAAFVLFGFIGGGLMVVVLGRNEKILRSNELKREITVLTSQLSSSSAHIESEAFASLQTRFGVGTLQESLKLRDERNMLIAKVMTD